MLIVMAMAVCCRSQGSSFELELDACHLTGRKCLVSSGANRSCCLCPLPHLLRAAASERPQGIKLLLISPVQLLFASPNGTELVAFEASFKDSSLAVQDVKWPDFCLEFACQVCLWEKMSQTAFQQWNYFILNLKITKPGPAPNPEEASKKLKGTLSPSFIKDQFPQEYKEVKQGPALEKQIQVLLEQLGAKGWELINISTIGTKLLFFFKRPASSDASFSSGDAA